MTNNSIITILKPIVAKNAKKHFEQIFNRDERILVVSVNENQNTIRAKCSNNDYWDFNYKDFIESIELFK
jgi:hypothetical protein